MYWVLSCPTWIIELEDNKQFISIIPRKIHFKNGRHGGHLGFLIGRILDNFDLQVALILPTKYRVNRPSGSGEKAQNRFSRWWPWQLSWIFSYF